jgi:HK97 family phage prohead protease
MKKETRYFKSPVEYRAEGEDTGFIEGVAAVVNQTTDLGWFKEMIMPGAFDDVLQDDVRALKNHDPNFILARTKSNTLTIGLNDKGDLTYRYKTPDRTFAKDLEDEIRSGDIDQSSFGFQVKEVSWEFDDENPNNDLRKIIKIERLFDVSPVTFPAYEGTRAEAKSKENLQEERNSQIIKPENHEIYHEEKERKRKIAAL